MLLKVGKIYQESEIESFRAQGYEFEAVDGGVVLSGWQGRPIDSLRECNAVHRIDSWFPKKESNNDKFKAFAASLEALCISHKVRLSTSYDGNLLVFDQDDSDPLMGVELVDETELSE